MCCRCYEICLAFNRYPSTAVFMSTPWRFHFELNRGKMPLPQEQVSVLVQRLKVNPKITLSLFVGAASCRDRFYSFLKNLNRNSASAGERSNFTLASSTNFAIFFCGLLCLSSEIHLTAFRRSSPWGIIVVIKTPQF